MPTYNLHGLESRTFQQMVQALAIWKFGPNVIVYGDGPDGGRDASFMGKVNYSTGGTGWDGYGVLQAKFCQKPTGDPKKDGKWVKDELAKDIKKFISNPTRYRQPEYYLLITNIGLTPDPQTGSDAKIRKELVEIGKKLGLKGFDVWDGNKLQRFLDGNRDVALTYGGFVLAGDVLKEMQTLLKDLHPNFQNVMSDFLQGEFSGAEQYARLKEAGSAAERKTPLAEVFIDLPVSADRSLDPPDEKRDENGRLPDGFAKSVVNIGGLRMDNESARQRCPQKTGQPDASPESGRFVLIGGPGQGKSTLGQFICQLYRAAILKDLSPAKTSWETRITLGPFIDSCKKLDVNLPQARRFPFRVELKAFADDLAKGKCDSLLTYLAKQIDKRSAQSVERNDLEKWLGGYPWFLVLDGLDEVPASANREALLEQIRQFSVHCATRNADVLIIATSRPQGYSEAFERKLFSHWYLSPLSIVRATQYAQGLVSACYPSDAQLRSDILERLGRAADRVATQRLMRSPLQVTILTVLAELRGELPDDRWHLFHEYYQTICNRETQRNLGLSGILREYNVEIEQIHQHCGLRLQVANEIAGENDALLNEEDFAEIVSKCLADRFEDQEIERAAVGAQIMNAALERLVFLVSPQGEEVGFEIRSLQEFMAGEALMYGSDQQICDRLRAIAPYPYWRNVFLFAAGKCVRERRHLLEAIIGMCHTINAEQEDPAFVITLSGSHLALDLLEDATFRLLPKHGRALAEIALRLLDLPWTPEIQRLSNLPLAQPGIDTVFATELEKRVHLNDFDERITAWYVLVGIVSKKSIWAHELADKCWPDNRDEQWKILTGPFSPPPNAWHREKLLSLIPYLDPIELFERNQVWPHLINDLCPPWVRATLETVRNQKLRSAEVRLWADARDCLKFQFCRIEADLFQWHDFGSMPALKGKWCFFSAAYRFSTSLTKEGLYQTLLWLADNISPNDISGFFISVLPWPLAVCLVSARTIEQLRELAQRILNGEYGSTEDWINIERSWMQEGLSLEEFKSGLSSGDFSFHFAWRELWMYFDLEGPEETDKIVAALEKMISLSAELVGTPRHDLLTHLTADCIKYFAGCEAESTAETRSLINPDLVRRCLLSGRISDVVETIAGVAPQVSPSDEWLDLLDWIGRNEYDLYLSQRFKRNTTFADILIKGFQVNPKRVGLLTWLEVAEFSDAALKVPVHLLGIDPSDSPTAQKSKILLRLATGDLSDSQIVEMAQHIAPILTTQKELWLTFAILRQRKLSGCAGIFVVELVRRTDRKVHRKLFNNCVHALWDWLGMRQSPLQDPKFRVRLGLPG